MTGFNDDNSLVNGVPAKQIGPETGSFGDAIMTRKGQTSQGVDAATGSPPAPATAPDDLGETRSFAETPSRAGGAPPTDEQSAAQQIADGGDHIKHGRHLPDQH